MYPVCPEFLPDPIEGGRFQVSFARTREDLKAIQRLRFEVFNLELGEGLDESFTTGLDADRFDPVCHHLIVSHTKTGQVIGTYRMQTSAMAQQHIGFYSADEFDLAGFPDAIREAAVEVGSACCSLTSQNRDEGRRVMDHLVEAKQVRTDLRIEPRPDWRCYEESYVAPPAPPGTGVHVPKLFSLYLRYGGKVCGPPALDRFFKTIDYLVLLDIEDFDAEARNLFFR
jgi:putative hemolysin